MKIILSIALGACLLFGQALAEEKPAAPKAAKDQREKWSYSLGYQTGSKMKNQEVDVDPDIYVRAFREGFAGDKAAMTEQEMGDAIKNLQMEIRAAQVVKRSEAAEKQKQLAEKNKKEGDAFMAENALKEGVVTLPDGLQYKIITEGTGRRPAGTDIVKVHYRGSLIDGTEFDSSFKRGEPSVFGVDKVIKGWTEALLLMKEGSKWVLYIPSDLAYGLRGAGGKIGPNQPLIFEVELISVEETGTEDDKTSQAGAGGDEEPETPEQKAKE